MHWNDQQADRYEQSFQTPKGQFVLERKSQLLQRLISTWPRRRQRLLDVGCGAGHFTRMFWEWGFDVSGIDPSSSMLRLARKRLGDRVELQVGVAEHLPYDDNEFDFVSLISSLEFCEEPEVAVAEAVRVARKGLLVSFVNRHSLYYLTHVKLRKGEGSLWPRNFWFSWWEIQRLIHAALGTDADEKAHKETSLPGLLGSKMRTGVEAVMGRQNMVAGSILPGPVWTWKNLLPFKHTCGIFPPFVGTFVAVRVDLLGGKAGTPLMAWKTEPSL